MEIAKILFDVENKKITKSFLYSCVALYNLKTSAFVNLFKQDLVIAKKLKIFFLTFEKRYYEIEDETISDLCWEIKSYFLHKEKKSGKKVKKIYRPFSMRNEEDLIIFEDFLDKMLKLLKLSPLHFVKVFPLCPKVFWDKVEELRDTSPKILRDSEEFLSCLLKSKAISFAHSEFFEKFMFVESIYDEFIDQYEEQIIKEREELENLEPNELEIHYVDKIKPEEIEIILNDNYEE
jgi:hypothetical protein